MLYESHQTNACTYSHALRTWLAAYVFDAGKAETAAEVTGASFGSHRHLTYTWPCVDSST